DRGREAKVLFDVLRVRLADALESGERGCVAFFLVALLEEVELELHRVGRGGDLARSDVGDEQFRPLLRHAGCDDAAPGMAEQDQWRARKALVQLCSEIDPVGN